MSRDTREGARQVIAEEADKRLVVWMTNEDAAGGYWKPDPEYPGVWGFFTQDDEVAIVVYGLDGSGGEGNFGNWEVSDVGHERMMAAG